MINGLWAGMILAGVLMGAITGDWNNVTHGALSGATDGVQLCLSLLGAYCLWMGLLRVAGQAGLLAQLSRVLARVLRPLFALPASSPAWSPISVNLAANLLGMGNAATPAGLEAMHALKAHTSGSRASNAMVMFLSINTSSIQLLPTTVIAMRLAAGSTAAYDVILPTLVATTCSTVAAILACKALERVWP